MSSQNGHDSMDRTHVNGDESSHHRVSTDRDVTLEKGFSSKASSPENPQHTPSVSITFPEGGLQGWLTVLGGSLTLFCTFGMIQTFGVYQDYYTRVHLNNHTPSQISWIGSVQVFLLFVIGLPAGKLFDDGHFHLCMISGGIVFVFSSFMLSLCKPHQYYQPFLAQGIGMGIGMGLMFLPAVSIASHYFRRRRSMAMGVVVAGSSLGAVLHPILLNNTFDKKDGFAWGVRYASFLDMGILIIANLLMRTRLPPRQQKLEIGKMFRENLITDVPYLIFMAGAFLVFWGLFIPFFYLQLYAALHGISPTLVTYSVSIMNGAAIFGRTLPNFAADRYGIFQIMVPSTFLTGGLVFALMGAKTVAGVVMFGILYGFFSGGFMSLATPAAASFSTNPDQSDLGLRVGVAAAMMGLACLTGNPIAGALLSPPQYTWWRPFLFSTIVMIAGSMLLFLSGWTKHPKRV